MENINKNPSPIKSEIVIEKKQENTQKNGNLKNKEKNKNEMKKDYKKFVIRERKEPINWIRNLDEERKQEEERLKKLEKLKKLELEKLNKEKNKNEMKKDYKKFVIRKKKEPINLIKNFVEERRQEEERLKKLEKLKKIELEKLNKKEMKKDYKKFVKNEEKEPLNSITNSAEEERLKKLEVVKANDFELKNLYKSNLDKAYEKNKEFATIEKGLHHNLLDIVYSFLDESYVEKVNNKNIGEDYKNYLEDEYKNLKAKFNELMKKFRELLNECNVDIDFLNNFSKIFNLEELLNDIANSRYNFFKKRMNYVNSYLLNQSKTNNIFELNIAKEKYKINKLVSNEINNLELVNEQLKVLKEKQNPTTDDYYKIVDFMVMKFRNTIQEYNHNNRM